ncbi:hypothetical protein NCCP2222_04200 [Sporosarcina sp. NCCP-2222]|nr:hypothetical protein NCCP2222_04200 [Sporosarcina sp. NCCP-2222]
MSGLEWKAATPAGTARAEDPGLSLAKEAAEAVPAESVRLERKSGCFEEILKSLINYKFVIQRACCDKNAHKFLDHSGLPYHPALYYPFIPSVAVGA